MTYIGILLVFVFFAGIAMTVNEGLWSNTVSLFCVTLGGILAWYWGPVLGGFVVDRVEPGPESEWAFWFASLWGAYFLGVTLLRVIADRSSRVRMRFFRPLDQAGGIFVGLLVAAMFASFTAYSLFIPVSAGVWKVDDGAPWVQQTINLFARPMYSVGKTFLGEDFPNLSQ